MKDATMSKRTRSQKTASFKETSRILSPEEKHRLILAHASMRTPKDPVQRITMWAGLSVAVLAIVGGWWVTVGSQVRQNIRLSDTDTGAIRSMTERLNAFTEAVTNEDSTVGAVLNDPTSSAQASEFGELIQAVLEGEDDANAYERDDLLAPKRITSTSTQQELVSDKEPEEEDSGGYAIDPNMPGLTPSEPLIND